MIRKIFQNGGGTYLVSIPLDYVREMGLTKEDNVNIERVGNTLHVTKVVLQ
jgi:hypothetical protein